RSRLIECRAAILQPEAIGIGLDDGGGACASRPPRHVSPVVRKGGEIDGQACRRDVEIVEGGGRIFEISHFSSWGIGRVAAILTVSASGERPPGRKLSYFREGQDRRGRAVPRI